jgi:hypothetical protein
MHVIVHKILEEIIFTCEMVSSYILKKTKIQGWIVQDCIIKFIITYVILRFGEDHKVCNELCDPKVRWRAC